MLVRIHALRVGNNRDDNTVTLKVEATDLTDSLYTLVQHMSDWNFGPELCLSDKCGTHLFSGYKLRDYNITDGDWIIAGHGTRQPFSPQPWTTLRRVTTPTTTTTTTRQPQPQLTYDSASYDAPQIASALMRSAVASPEAYNSFWKTDVIAIATLRSESFRRFLTSGYVVNRSAARRDQRNRDPFLPGHEAPFVPCSLIPPINIRALWPPPGQGQGDVVRTIEVPSTTTTKTHCQHLEAPP